MAMAAPGGTPPGFNPSIGLTSVPTAEVAEKGQVRDSVSIPQSGLQAFRQSSLNLVSCTKASFNPSIGLTSVPTNATADGTPFCKLFQSLNRAYKRSDKPSPDKEAAVLEFQSLNRAYKRSDPRRRKSM